MKSKQKIYDEGLRDGERIGSKTSKAKTNKKRKMLIWQIKTVSLFIIFSAVALFATWIEFGLLTMPTANVEASYRKPEVEKVKEPTMQEWVMGEIRKAGLNEYEAWAFINSESRWNTDAVNINNNRTYDAGIWQINSIHKISNACKFDYQYATKWAIEKRLHDGNWSAWYGARAQGIK
jgi:hypothetical protein